jgi:hypothetical protein
VKTKLLVVATVLLVAGGCAGIGGGGGAKATVKDAFSALEDYEGFTWAISIDSDAASLTALSEGSLTEDVAQKILDSSVVFSQKLDEDPLKQHVDLSLNIAGNDDVFQMRFVNDTLFLRADVNTLIQTFGGNPSEVDAFVQQAETQGLSFARPAVEGEWLGVTGLMELAKQFGAPSPAKSADSEAFRALGEAIEEDAKVEEAGSDDAGDHYEVSISARKAFERIMNVAREAGAGTGLPAGALPDASQVPDKDLVFDVWVDDGRLTQVAFDFTKLEDLAGEEMPEGVDRFAILIAIDEFTGEVEAPSDFVNVDPQQIMQSMFGAMSGSASGSSTTTAPAPTEFPCEMLESEPEELQAMYYEECPQLKG